MSEDIKPEVIKRTQDSLKKFVKKPPLTDKLLRKPPFRFLHDLITSLMKETGFLQGLYTPEELNPDNIKDRDAKIAFLEKLIAVVKLSTAANVTARPTKIVAGLEVEKTNELLQVIGKALEKKIDSSKAVEQVLNKGNKKTTKSNKEAPKAIKSSKDIVENKTKDKTDNLKKKKPSSRAGATNAVVKEAVTKLKQSSKKENENITPTRKKEKSPTKSISDKPDRRKPISENSSNNKPETPEKINEVANIDSILPTTNADNSVSLVNNEKVNLQAESILEREPDAIKINNNGTNVVDQVSENKQLPESEEKFVLPVSQTEENNIIHDINKDEKKNKEESKEDKQENENESKEEVKTKRPSSAHPAHRRHSSARRISDVSNGTENVTNNQNASVENILDNSLAEVKVLSASTQNSSETSIKTSPALTKSRIGVRPPSARPGAPRVRDRGHVEVVEDVRSPSVPVNVIVDAGANKDEDDENLVVLDSQAAVAGEKVELPTPDLIADVSANGIDLSSHEQGHLVAQILETQRELELSSSSAPKVEIEWEGGRKRERETASREVERLRGAIQSLTRAANPLGKLIDFLQEDVDSMQREFLNWQQMNAQLSKELQSEQSLTEASLEPLRHQLDELEQSIQDELEKVSAAKANVIRNDERILKLLPGAHSS